MNRLYWKHKRLKFSAKVLADNLDLGGIGPKTKPIKPIGVVINFGQSTVPDWIDKADKIINTPESVGFAVDKVKTLKLLSKHGVPCLRFTQKKEEAEVWTQKGKRVVIRQRTKSSKGKGIIIACDDSDLVNARLYTRYFGKTHEFRVHVLQSKVIDYTQKKKLSSNDSPNYQIRTLNNGWVFAHEDVFYYDDICSLAISALNCLGLDFGAVDILANIDKETKQLKNYTVCEINTAPGLINTKTVKAYVDGFKEILNAS